MQITESEIVSENCSFRCMEQGISYYRFNPTLKEVRIYRLVKTISMSCLLVTMQEISPSETDLTILVDTMMNARCYTVANLDFYKLVLNFEKIKTCRKLLAPSYSEKIEKLLTSTCKNEL